MSAPSLDDQDRDRERGSVSTWARRGLRLRRLWSWAVGGGAGDTAVAIGAAMAIAAAPTLMIYDRAVHGGWQDAVRQLASERPKEVAAQPLGEAAMLYEVAGRDKAGRIAWFDFVVLGRETVWVRGRTDQITRDGALVAADAFKSAVIDRQLGARIASARQLIGVGVASEEGLLATEEARADARAKRIARWLIDAVPAAVPVWSLSLGQYQGLCGGCDVSVTDWQRPIIIIGLVDADFGVNLAEALRDALSDRANLPSPDRYSRFAFVRER